MAEILREFGEMVNLSQVSLEYGPKCARNSAQLVCTCTISPTTTSPVSPVYLKDFTLIQNY